MSVIALPVVRVAHPVGPALRILTGDALAERGSFAFAGHAHTGKPTEVACCIVLDRHVVAGLARLVANVIGAFIVVDAIRSRLAFRLRITAPHQRHNHERAYT